MAGALAQHAEATMDRIGPERQGMVREIFRNLVTAQGTRAVAEREELLSLFPDRKAAEEVLRAADRRAAADDVRGESLRGRLRDVAEESAVAVPARGSTLHRIEVVHESLLKAWPRLVRWQAQDEEGAVLRDQLKQAAHLWEEKGRSPDVLWSGTAFREFELWRERYAGKLTALEEHYAQAMVERARRRRRLRRGAVAAAFLVLAGVSAAIAVSRHQAARARDQARAEALRAEASRLVTLAQLRLADDPTEALAYATASLELADTPEARVFVMKALWEAPPSFTLPVGPPAQRWRRLQPRRDEPGRRGPRPGAASLERERRPADAAGRPRDQRARPERRRLVGRRPPRDRAVLRRCLRRCTSGLPKGSGCARSSSARRPGGRSGRSTCSARRKKVPRDAVCCSSGPGGSRKARRLSSAVSPAA